jgi:hypothetical protein
VSEGQLYLNYNRIIRRLWLMDVPGYLSKADANWPVVSAR